MHLDKADGTRSEVTLLRPDAWLEERRVEPNGRVHLCMPEQGIDGMATVDAIEPCPVLAPGPGQVVTGTFAHWRGGLLHIRLEGLTEPLGVTDNHPLYSVDRRDFVHAAELRVGESLRATSGVVRIESIERVARPQRVYNLEVHGDHVYRVTSLGVLAHNTTPTGRATIHRLQRPLHVTIEVENGGTTIHTHLVRTPNGEHTFVNDIHGTIPDRMVKGTAEVDLPDPAAAQARQIELLRMGDLGPYDTYFHNCVSHVCDILRAGGFDVPPPGDSAQIRLIEALRRGQE